MEHMLVAPESFGESRSRFGPVFMTRAQRGVADKQVCDDTDVEKCSNAPGKETHTAKVDVEGGIMV